MARPTRTPLQRVLSLTQPDGKHLIWKGRIHKGRPRFDRRIHPVRILFGLDDPRIWFRTTCTVPNCISRDCQQLFLIQDHKYGDLPAPTWRDPETGLTIQHLDEVQNQIRNLREGTTTVEELRDDYPSAIIKEIERRIKL